MVLNFHTLWNNHPTITEDEYPCSTGTTSNFTNHCAIRMGTCLAKCGVDTTQIPGVRHCWFPGHENNGHTLAAEELANGLTKYPIAGVQKIRKINPENFSTSLHGKTGIIFFKDYWERILPNAGGVESRSNKSGDHIDLWNKSGLTSLNKWIRIFQTISGGVYDYYEKKELKYKGAKIIWFWEVL